MNLTGKRGIVVELGATPPHIERALREFARSGAAVLLSPACSSFDMFTDDKARGAS